jgi:D-alanyl-D-alanine carboxypeptidase (penicillin-binding protein 5/6)
MKAFLKCASKVCAFFIILILAGGAWAAPLQTTVTYPQGDAKAIMDYIRNEDRTSPPELEAQGAILIDMATGEVLAGKNQNDRLYPASTTKIMTALLALEYADLDEIVTVGDEANLCAYDSSKCWLDLGEQIKMADLIRGLLIHSGGDAAFTIAAYIGRKIADDMSLDYNAAIAVFVERMNTRAEELGVNNTQFKDPDGYHNPEHFTTAQNLAVISRKAMEQPFFREVVATEQYTIEDWDQYEEEDPTKKVIRYWTNTNALILPSSDFYYEPAIGIKTGYTTEAEHCLVAAAKKDDTELLAVVLYSSKDGKWYDSVKLLEYGFDNFETHWTAKKGETMGKAALINPAIDGPQTVDIIAAEGRAVLADINNPPAIGCTVTWQTPLFVSQDTEEHGPFDVKLLAPIAAGTTVGTAHYTLDGNAFCDIPLTVESDIPAYAEPTPAPESAQPAPGQGKGLIPSLRERGLWPVPALVAALVLIWVIYLIFFKPRSRRYPSHYTSKSRRSRRRPRRRYR